jgi:hypothetical protein
MIAYILLLCRSLAVAASSFPRLSLCIRRTKEQDNLDAVLALEEDEHQCYVQMCQLSCDDEPRISGTRDVEEWPGISMAFDYEVTPNVYLDDDTGLGERNFEEEIFNMMMEMRLGIAEAVARNIRVEDSDGDLIIEDTNDDDYIVEYTRDMGLWNEG